jgi:hypothetical protein
VRDNLLGLIRMKYRNKNELVFLECSLWKNKISLFPCVYSCRQYGKNILKSERESETELGASVLIFM